MVIAQPEMQGIFPYSSSMKGKLNAGPTPLDVRLDVLTKY
jgi:hypothetical protein